MAPEVRAGRTYYKLRFRHDRRQVVRYLGADPAAAEAVRRELGELQAASRARREAARLGREARRAGRAAKAVVETLLEGTGFAFHGYAIRRRRGPAGAPKPAVRRADAAPPATARVAGPPGRTE